MWPSRANRCCFRRALSCEHVGPTPGANQRTCPTQVCYRQQRAGLEGDPLLREPAAVRGCCCLLWASCGPRCARWALAGASSSPCSTSTAPSTCQTGCGLPMRPCQVQTAWAVTLPIQEMTGCMGGAAAGLDAITQLASHSWQIQHPAATQQTEDPEQFAPCTQGAAVACCVSASGDGCHQPHAQAVQAAFWAQHRGHRVSPFSKEACACMP